MHGIYDLKETLCNELEEYGTKGQLDVGALDIVDKLAHTIKNLDKIIENYEEGYSGTYMYDDGMGGRMPRSGVSYARGRRGSNVRRDSMGRYSRDNKMMVNELKELMDDAPDDHVRQEIHKLVQKLESM